MLTLTEKKYIYNGMKEVLTNMGFQVRYFPLLGKIQDKSGKVKLNWDEVNYVDTWGTFSRNSIQDYSVGKPTETNTESKIAFLVTDFDTFSINPKTKDAVEIVIRGERKRFVIVGNEPSADFPDLYYVCNIDSIEHINP